MADGKFFFEGVEKVLEIDFVPSQGPARGLRELTRTQLDALCTAARCTIISTMSNDHLDSYVLSESSLFVYPHKIILKTCGTTTLLMVLPLLREYTAALGMSVEWVAYTRKDFQRPGQQQFPHRDPAEECAYLKSHFPEGDAFILGPLTGDHWVVYVADYVDRPTDLCVDRTVDMMMFGIDDEVAKLFMKDTARFPSDKDVTKASGIDTLLPGSQIQEFCFDPCGYSMNGLLYDAYWTIHITPESHCSYASFETNIRMTNYSALIKAVLAIFRPRKWTMTLFADTAASRSMRASPFQSVLSVPLVESTHQAIMGPCVVTHDLHGNAYVTFDGPTGAGSVSSAGTPDAGGKAAAAGGSPARGDRTGSESSIDKALAADGLQPLSSDVSAAATAASVGGRDSAVSDVAAISPLPAHAGSSATPVAASLTAVEESKTSTSFTAPPLIEVPRGGGGAGATALSPGGASTPVSAVPAIASMGSKTSMARIASLPAMSAAPGVMVRGKGVLTYLMSTKCQTEFVGEYSAMVGNFTMVHAAHIGAGGASALDIATMAEAAKEALALPRAKHVVVRRAAEESTKRVRTESI